MTRHNKHANIKSFGKSILSLVVSLGFLAFSAPAFADQDAATAAINRAEAKIEMVTRQAGLAGDSGDQSYNMARQRLVDARTSLDAGKYESAEMLAEESALLASLTAERAVLASLKLSHDNLVKSATATAQ